MRFLFAKNVGASKISGAWPQPPMSPGVGNALRDAYQEALREDVPPEMLDLLGKLG